MNYMPFPLSSCFKCRLRKKETITDKSSVRNRNLIPGRNLPIPVWSVSPPQLPHPVQYLCFILFCRNRYCSFLPGLFTWLTAVGVQHHPVLYSQHLAEVCSHLLQLGSEEQGKWQLGAQGSLCRNQTQVQHDSSHHPFLLFCPFLHIALMSLILCHVLTCMYISVVSSAD